MVGQIVGLTTNLIAHTDKLEQLLSFVQSGQFSASFLLRGCKGVGKATLAKHFAAKILEAELAQVLNKSHPDLLIVEKQMDEKKGAEKTEILVDDVRKINSFLRLTPAQSKWRVVIVDGADEMNIASANSILKILEEPPQNSIIILLSHSGKVLPTIRSRCRQVSLPELTNEQIKQILNTQNLQINDDLLTIANGSAGYALMLSNDNAYKLYEAILNSQVSVITTNIDKANNWQLFKFIFNQLLLNKLKQEGDISGLLKIQADLQQQIIELEAFNQDKKLFIINLFNRLAGNW